MTAPTLDEIRAICDKKGVRTGAENALLGKGDKLPYDEVFKQSLLFCPATDPTKLKVWAKGFADGGRSAHGLAVKSGLHKKYSGPLLRKMCIYFYVEKATIPAITADLAKIARKEERLEALSTAFRDLYKDGDYRDMFAADDRLAKLLGDIDLPKQVIEHRHIFQGRFKGDMQLIEAEIVELDDRVAELAAAEHTASLPGQIQLNPDSSSSPQTTPGSTDKDD